MTGGIVSMKVAIVWPPGVTATVAVPALRLLPISNPTPGRVLTADKVVPVGRVSVMLAGPAGTSSARLQVPAGAGPAGTVSGVPATLKEKSVPTTTPLPATLQT